MIGRLIAAVILVLAVALFIWSYQPSYQATLQRTGDDLGLEHRRQPPDPDRPAPGYEARGERVGRS